MGHTEAQFLSGADMKYPYEKAREAGAREIWLTERGNMYGYNNLLVDFRPRISSGTPVIAHSTTAG